MRGIQPSKNGPTSASFWFIFGLFKTNNIFLPQINVKCPFIIWDRDSNSRPPDHSPPLTTRTGLQSISVYMCTANFCARAEIIDWALIRVLLNPREASNPRSPDCEAQPQCLNKENE